MIDQPLGPVDRLNNFLSLFPYEQVIYSVSGKYNQDAVFAFMYDKRMYFKVSTARAKMLKYINILGVFVDPSEEAAFVSCDGTICITADDRYPINACMLPYMKQRS